MKIGAQFPTKYLKAADLGGQPMTLTIQTVQVEDVDGKGDHKPVVRFLGMEQGLVLNVTNANTITQVMGTDETDHWQGKPIEIYPTQTEFGGKMVPCIRVMLPQVRPQTALRGPTPQQVGNAVQRPLQAPGYEHDDPMNYTA